jgi:hypothetical protein
MRLPVTVAAWLFASAAGFYFAHEYTATPGRAGDAPASWPAGSHLPLAADRPMLLMFLHPRCPCSRASVDELEVLLSNCEGRLAATVVFQDADGTAAEFALWQRAAAVHDVTVVSDGGSERRLFGSHTSGETLLFAADGRLLFRGGITAGRGHRGDNPGRDAVEALVLNPALAADIASPQGPVYGCPLATEPTSP